jgi:hypothetical protein
MAQTLKNLVDSIANIATRFHVVDEWRVSFDWIAYKALQIRAQLIIAQYNNTGQIDMNWLSDCGLLTFHEVPPSDNITTSCKCPIGKTTIPQTIPLQSRDSNLDLGIYSLTSLCGRYGYYPMPIQRWLNIPSEHVMSNFKYYFRINSQLYVSNTPTQLRLIGIFLNPIEGKLINSAPVASGSIVLNTVYYVSTFGGSVIYSNVSYAPGTTFTGGASANFTTTNGLVYLNSQVASYSDVDPFPCSGDMIRQIELEILTKEFNIEKAQLTDVRNDSVDDANKTVTI